MGPSGSLLLHLATSSLVSSRHAKTFIHCLPAPTDPLGPLIIASNVGTSPAESPILGQDLDPTTPQTATRNAVCCNQDRACHINQYIAKRKSWCDLKVMPGTSAPQTPLEPVHWSVGLPKVSSSSKRLREHKHCAKVCRVMQRG